MVTLGGGGGSSGDAEKYKYVNDAKHLLDMIGETVQKKVHDAAKNCIDDLKGSLSKARYPNDKSPEGSTENNPCKLQYDYNTNVTEGFGQEYPCKDRPDVRFSDTEGAQCDKSKIKDNKGKSEGACAPYRRSSLCDHHLSYMNAGKTNTTDNLLLEVCLAALHEGDSLKHYSEKLNLTYSDSRSQLCTELARSFADIGDIVRGRDLYLGGNKKEKNRRDDLEDKLKKIFGKIKGNNSKLKSLTDDQIREYWWELNRETVWKAITCNAQGNTYFRATCIDGQSGAQARNKCTCNNGDVPTYFDYVPQYLRWFEEWAEDFCRKKKKKVENLEQQCRGKSEEGEPRYCDRNGFDCERTKYKKGYFVIDKGCNTCSVWCRLYESWIDNQKKEFLKQKKKCENEISGKPRQKRDAGSSGSSSDDNGYEKKFYDILKNDGYGKVDKFLDLLSKEEVCKKFSEDEGKIDFTKHDNKNNDQKGTFYRSKYCEECPLCGVKKKSNGGSGNQWEEKDTNQCTSGNLYTISTSANPIDINVLSFGDKREDRETKLNKFCAEKNGGGGVGGRGGGGGSGTGGRGDSGTSDSKELYQEWKCYKGEDVEIDGEDEDYEHDYHSEVENAGGLCILENKNKTSDNDPKEFQKTFNNFFYFWIVRFLNDSMYWRDKINNCIEKAKKGKCQNDCEKLCGCFKEWIGKKKTEWGQIKTHFDTQKGFDKADISSQLGFNLRMTADFVLKTVLKLDELFNNIKSGYGDVKELKGINKILEEEKQKSQAEVGADNQNNTTIDKLLKHEGEEAGECLKTHKEKCEKKAKPESVARSEDNQPALPDPTVNPDENADDDAEEDEEEEENEVAETAVEGEGSVPQEEGSTTTTPEVKPACEIVDELFKDTNKFSDACKLKYGPGGKEKFPNWKCVTPSGDEKSGGKDGATGGLCIPPRRRRLYVTPLTKLTGGDGTTQSSQPKEAGAPQVSPSATSSGSQSDPLLTAFVESAAVETFFLWHKYKMEKKKEKEEAQENVYIPTDENDEEQNKLQKSGKIPPDFLRLMFYTLGDYRDICVGNTDIVVEALSSSEKEKMNKIQQKIKDIVEKLNGDTPGQQPSDKRTALWGDFAQYIWNGMIYALTYNTDSGGKDKTPTHNDTVKGALWDSDKNTPQNTQYQYNTVKLDDTSGAKTSNAPLLTDFISRPPYFRYLEEWGQHFCKTRKRMLKDIIYECRNRDRGGHKYCSGDGYDCEKIKPENYENISDLDCRDCYKQCRKYRKWIDKKFEEYNNQKSKYDGELQKLPKDNNCSGGDNKKFCTEIQKHTTAGSFLAALKHCKHGQTGGEQGNEEYDKNKIDFEHPEKTFNPSTYCKACPIYGVTCNSGGRGGCTPKTKNDKNITGDSTVIDIILDDAATNDTDNELHEKCKDYGLYTNLKKQEWKCQKMSDGVHQCKLNNAADSEYYDDKMEFNVFLQRWIKDFLEYYYKSKNKINLCAKDENLCIQECAVKSFFEKDPFFSAFINAIKVDKDIEGFGN
ncbi:hypothetical protein PFHG_04368, partial [Plasmodium falciparum HB3]